MVGRKRKYKLYNAKLLGVMTTKRCAVCNTRLDEFDLKYATTKIGKKIVCSGCAEALYYAFRRDYLNPKIALEPLAKASKDLVEAMEWRLAGMPKKKGDGYSMTAKVK